VHCVNNLKNVYLAFQVFSLDNNDRFPFEISTNVGGTLELRSNIVAQFRGLSNELVIPFTIVCPERIPPMTVAREFTQLSNTNIGYFLNLSATRFRMNQILSGDTGFSLEGRAAVPGQSTILTNPIFRYRTNLHENKRSPAYVLSDVSVKYFGNSVVNNYETADMQAPNEILIP